MDSAHSRLGLTRTGVLVSAACVGMLLLLLFPFLLQRRAAARRDLCQLRLGTIALAVANYGEVFTSLPYGTQQNRDLPPEKRLSWYPQVWPFIANDAAPPNVNWNEPWDSLENQNALAYIGNTDPPENATDSPLLVCPAMLLERSAGAPSPTSYVGIAGVGMDAAELTITDPRAGIWGYDRCTQLDLLPHGVSNILLLAETGHKIGPWIAGGPPTIRGLDPDTSPLIGPECTLGGNHPKGANVVMADNSDRFLNNNIDPRVLTQLAVLGNAEVKEQK